MRWLLFGRRKGPKKYRLTRLATRLENFLLSVWSKKLVLVTSTLLLITGYFFRNLLVGIPEDLVETAQEHELRAAQIMQDVDKWSDTANKINVAVHSFQDTILYVHEVADVFTKISTGDGKVESYLINTNKVQTFLTKLKDSRDKLITAIAAVRTAAFQRAEFVDFYKGFEEDLRDIDSMLANFQNVYQPILGGDLSDLRNASKRLQDYQMKFQEAVQVLEQRSSSMLQRGQNIRKSVDILESRKEFGETALAVRMLTLLILISLTVFCAILTYKLRKPKPPPLPMTQAQRDTSRRQREKYQSMREARKK